MIKRKFLISTFLMVFAITAYAGDLFNTPKFQAFDSSGLPLSGGKVYTYIAGTTTAKTTYSDYALTTPNTNPVILSSRGDATIYFSGSGAYKVVLKDSNDNTIWTEDNLIGLYNSAVLGTASIVDTGTASDEIPLNSDLGTASIKDTGIAIGNVVEVTSDGGSAGLPVLKGGNLTSLDGENIQDDTIDDDSIDFVDVTLTDLTFDVGGVDTTEFGYLNGVTSSIQTQINTKVASSSDSIVKAWVNFDGTGTPSIKDSYNVSGTITDNGTGDYTITWDTDFANTGYCVAGSALYTGGGQVIVSVITKAVGSCRIRVAEFNNTAIDVTDISVMAIGDQ